MKTENNGGYQPKTDNTNPNPPMGYVEPKKTKFKVGQIVRLELGISGTINNAEILAADNLNGVDTYMVYIPMLEDRGAAINGLDNNFIYEMEF